MLQNYKELYRDMGTDYHRLGDYIRPVDVRNRDLMVTELLGLSMSKQFRPSTSNVVGVDLSKYKVVNKNVFAFDPMSVIRVHKVPIAINNTDSPIIVSPAYITFECKDVNELEPNYLMMWFQRPEFDRYADFKSDAAVRGGYDWTELCETMVYIPSITRQREIVAEYETLTNRIRLNEQIIQRLEATAQALYRKMFVDNIDKENLPAGWRIGTLSDLGEIIGGATPSTDNPELWCDNGISWLSPADLSRQATKFISKGAKDITELGYNSCSTKVLPPGSVLFSSRAPIGLMAITINDVCTNQGFKSIIPKDNIGLEYVYYYVQSIKDKIAEENTGSTFDEVSGQTMKDYSAIIPPDELCDIFSKSVRPIFKHQQIIEQENAKLIELQSLLLARMGK